MDLYLIAHYAEDSYLSELSTDDEMRDHPSYSILYRISTGFQKGKKVFSLQTRPPMIDEVKSFDVCRKLQH